MLDSENLNEIDKKSPPKADQSRAGKIFFIVFGILIAASVAVTYWRIMVKKDYVIESQVDCDPYAEACFIWECDPASTVEGEACTGDAESDVWYFKVAKRNAGRIPLCDPETDEACDPWTCGEGEKDCSETLCTEDQLESQSASGCVDPVKYAEENPVEEEAVECEEGDAECEAAAAEETACEEGDTECEAGLPADKAEEKEGTAVEVNSTEE